MARAWLDCRNCDARPRRRRPAPRPQRHRRGHAADGVAVRDDRSAGESPQSDLQRHQDDARATRRRDDSRR